jgi:hypothetical protein
VWDYQEHPGVYLKDRSSNMTKPLKISPEERISAEEIIKHPWLQESQVIRQANALMATQLRDRKRLTWRWSWQEVQGGGASFCFQDSNMLRRTKYSKMLIMSTTIGWRCEMVKKKVWKKEVNNHTTQ